MSLLTRTKELAALGLNNSEIFAELELTPAALEGLLKRDPKFVFGIVQGRTEFLQPLVEKLVSLAIDPDSPKTSLNALLAAIERVDRSNATIMLAQEMVLLKGLAPSVVENTSPATVTELLRRKV